MRTVGQSAAAGLAMAAARFARSAYNVANVNTPNFKARAVDAVEPTRPTLSEQSRSSAMGNAGATPPPTDAYHGEMAASSTDLTVESLQQISAANAFKANLAVLRAEYERTRRVIDIKA
jgi:flagellar basal body rod protein FlgB